MIKKNAALPVRSRWGHQSHCLQRSSTSSWLVAWSWNQRGGRCSSFVLKKKLQKLVGDRIECEWFTWWQTTNSEVIICSYETVN